MCREVLHLCAKKGVRSPDDSDDLVLELLAGAHCFPVPELLRRLASPVSIGALAFEGDVLVSGHLFDLSLPWWQGADIARNRAGGLRSEKRLPLFLFLGSGLIGLAVLASPPTLLVLFERSGS